MGTNVNKNYNKKQHCRSDKNKAFSGKICTGFNTFSIILMTETLTTLTANGRDSITQILADINQISRDINQTIHNSVLHALFPKP